MILHASGDELDYENDIQRLTERSKATGQKKKTPAKETKFIQDFTHSYDEDDATGDENEKELADVAQKPGAKKLSSEKTESLVEKYRQPQNCSDVKGIKVNPEIWSQLEDLKSTTNYPQNYLSNFANNKHAD